jgi:hypothetical protein
MPRGRAAFLCERDRLWEEWSRLHRAPEQLADGAGVVHAQRWPDGEWSAALVLRAWQGCSGCVGDVLPFGDPGLLRTPGPISPEPYKPEMPAPLWHGLGTIGMYTSDVDHVVSRRMSGSADLEGELRVAERVRLAQ